MLNVINITKIYYGKTNRLALEDFSYSFSCKGVYYIKGNNGSGKSTLLKIIASKLSASAGKVYLNGDDNKEYLRDNVFYLDYKNMISTMTLDENIKLINNPKMAIEDFENILTKLELIDKRKLKVRQLSGGERKRFSIALAIYQGKSILLFDEPTSNLDKKSSEKLYRIIEDLGKEKLVIFTSHDDKIPSDMKYVTIDIEKDGKTKVEPEAYSDHAIEAKKETKLNPILFLKRQPLFHYFFIFIAAIMMFLPSASIFFQKNAEISRTNIDNSEIKMHEVLVKNYDENKIIDLLRPKFEFRFDRMEAKYFNELKIGDFYSGASWKFSRSSSLMDEELNPARNYAPSSVSNDRTYFNPDGSLNVYVNNEKTIIEDLSFSSNVSQFYLTEETYTRLFNLSLQGKSIIRADLKEYRVAFSDVLEKDEYYSKFEFLNSNLNMYFSSMFIRSDKLVRKDLSLDNIEEDLIMISSNSDFFEIVKQNVTSDYRVMTFIDPYRAKDAASILESNGFDIVSPMLTLLRVDENSSGYNAPLILDSLTVFTIISIAISAIYFVLRNKSKLCAHLVEMGHSNKQSSLVETLIYIPIYILSAVFFFIGYFELYTYYLPAQLVPLYIMGIIFAIGFIIQLCSIVLPQFLRRKKHD